MSYKVKEIYLTVQGEGSQTGRVAVFCRFTGCNLWTGHETDRVNAICNFCDTDFVGTDGPGGGVFFSAEEMTEHLLSFWVSDHPPFVVFTGGEPLLQIDDALISELKNNSVEIAIETNGTIIPPIGIDWVCVSPKGGTEIVVKSGEELKVVYPQNNLNLDDMLKFDFTYFSLQPMDGKDKDKNIKNALEYCKNNPKWNLSLQSHKLINIP
jgi:7-carboxy-7-deazaguanine synthase (Cx14CxxC type)